MAVAMCEGYRFGNPQPRTDAWLLFPLAIPGDNRLSSVGWDIASQQWGVNVRRYSSEDRHAGPIIDREKIGTLYEHSDRHGGFCWFASLTNAVQTTATPGDTRLEAAMRLYVYKHLGPELELPI